MTFEKREFDTTRVSWSDYSAFLQWMYKSIIDDLNKRQENMLGGIKQYGSVFSVRTKQGLRNYTATQGYIGKL